MSAEIVVRALLEEDRRWVVHFLKELWGSNIIVAHGEMYAVDTLPGFVALVDGHYAGLLTYLIEDDECEIVTLNSLQKANGVGTALIDAVKAFALQNGCKRLWLITTNDNLNGLRFYQKRGLVLVAVYRNAVERARKIKPQIPLVGCDNIPLRDEIELELLLDQDMVEEEML